MSTRKKSIAIAFSTGVILALVAVALRQGEPQVTPLTGFSAPFVFGRFNIPDENPLTNEAFELGRRLFYDARLSGNNKVSCATCHVQRLAFTDGKATAVGISGNPLAFNSMSLANLMWGPQRFFWDGRAASLEEQALIPIQHEDEMGQDLDELLSELESDPRYLAMFETALGRISKDNIAKALAAFVRALMSADSKYDQYLRGETILTEQEEWGRKLFMAHPDVKVSLRGGNCIDCHCQFLTSGFSAQYDGFSNNGLDDEESLPEGLQSVTHDPAHKGLFKVPTLRNIAVTAPYMHDGRLNSLEDVLEHYNSGIKRSTTLSPLILEANNLAEENLEIISLNLTAAEQTAIISFLHTLTDDQFLSDPKFGDPHR
jgi:cytochrome c peroxidase